VALAPWIGPGPVRLAVDRGDAAIAAAQAMQAAEAALEAGADLARLAGG